MQNYDYILMGFLAIACFLAGYAKGRLVGFDRGIKKGLEIRKEYPPNQGGNL